MTAQGFQDATAEPSRIRTFLAAASEPNYGLVPPEGVFVWDVDTDEERATLARLGQSLGQLPPTLHATTAHGEHVFLRWPEGVPRPLGRMFGLVTRWGSGRSAGYVIGPRSVHANGTEYAPAPDTVFEIATLPDEWARAAVGGGDDTIRIGPSGVTPEEVGVGHRHDYLRDTARHFAGTVRDADALFAAVWAVNQRLAQPKSEDEVRRAIGEVLTRFPADETEADPETGEIRPVPREELSILPPSALGSFPPPPAPEALEGLIGECVLDMARGTDASLVGLLGSFLAVCGAMVPARAYSRTEHSSSPFIALVGESSIGRKGTAMWRALEAGRLTWQADQVNMILLDGLNSGEALISELHRRRQFEATRRPLVALVVEDEFASMLQSRSREGSTLDAKLRSAFDGGPLSNRRRAESQVVMPPYWLAALTGITPLELRSMLGPGAVRNGSANRWLYLPVHRREVIPPDEPPILDGALTEQLVEARGQGHDRTLTAEAGASRVLSEYADHVMSDAVGLASDLVRRYQTHAFRIALVHAAVERSSVVTLGHVHRAIALTEHARAGIGWVFGQTVGNPDADLLLRHLQEHGSLRQNAITRNVIRDPIRRQAAIDELVRLGYGTVVPVPTTGRVANELQLTPLARGFRPFRPSIRESARDNTGPDRTEGSVIERGSRSRGAGQKLDESRSEAGQKLDVASTEASAWRAPCSEYATHRSSHRKTPDGWACDACHPPEETS